MLSRTPPTLPTKIKAVLIGNNEGCKTKCYQHLASKKSQLIGTIGVDWTTIDYDGASIMIWNTISQARFSFLQPTYARNAQVLLLCPLDRADLDNLIQKTNRLKTNHTILVVSNDADVISAATEKSLALVDTNKNQSDCLKIIFSAICKHTPPSSEIAQKLMR